MLTPLERNILVANRIALLLGILSLAMLTTLLLAFGPNVNTPLIFGLAVFLFLIILLNNKGYPNTGRILLSIVPGAFALMAAILAKQYGPGFTDILYYDARFFLILFAMVPCLVFDTSERAMLYGCTGMLLLILLLFDPVHELFGLGYYQSGFTGTSYYYINYVSAMVFFGIVAGAVSLKLVIGKAEHQNTLYRSDLIETNRKLSILLNDIEAQNEEMIAQSEELQASQDQLVAANQLIEKQNEVLEKQVIQVNTELQEANEELVKHNNELQQFSFSLSHNLRGPVARLLGLSNLANLVGKFEPESEIGLILNRIEISALELDAVTRELSSIVDIRNTLYQIRQPVDFHKEWAEIRRLLNVSEEFERECFIVDFAAPTMFSVRPMVHSILFHLVSNAIKYRSTERQCRIRISTRTTHDYTILEVSDNGLGIDLDLFRNDMFKMYKRFHMHKEGKGLGLYLIKSQAESLNGFVEVVSEPGEGSIFRVHIKNPGTGTPGSGV